MHIDPTRFGFEGNKSKRLRRVGNNDGPLQIDIISDSDTDKFLRGKDIQKVSDFNSKIRAWGDSVRGDLKISISSLIEKDQKLSDSLKNRYYSDKKPATDSSEIDRIGFSFRPEGVYVHLGVGRGYNRNGGTTIRSAKNRSNNIRRPKQWFNPVIQNHIADLSKIVSEYSSDMIINYTRIFIQS
jgi:hypothetical protein